mmetsp:Transcript_23055/g.34406  ORF Transcript_23055/g.34406 Transcript_23055/m.34406 type:complete len:201 (-) Transcript_23055:454-1056(-)
MSVMFIFHLNLVSFQVLLMFTSMKFLEVNTPTCSSNLVNLALPTSGLRSSANMLKLTWSWVTSLRLLHPVRLLGTSPSSWWHKISANSKWKIRPNHLPSLNLWYNSCVEKLVFHREDFRSLFALRSLSHVVLRPLMDAQVPLFLTTTSRKQRSCLRRSLVLNSLMTRMSCLMLFTPMFSLSGRSSSLSTATFPSSQLIFS